MARRLAPFVAVLGLIGCGSSGVDGSAATAPSTAGSVAATSAVTVPSATSTLRSGPADRSTTTSTGTTPEAGLTPLSRATPAGGPTLTIAWSRTTVPAGPYNGIVRADGNGLTSVNPARPDLVWLSDDGVAWEARPLPTGFAAADSSRSVELLAVVGTVASDGQRVPALATTAGRGGWVVTELDLQGLGPASRPDARPQVAVSGLRVIAAVAAGPAPGGTSDTSLVFVGDGGPPLRRQVNTRFADAFVTVGSQYLWWVGLDHAIGPDAVSTVYGPADPVGNVDYASIEGGWQPVARIAGEVRHVGGRDAGEEYFAVSDSASPSSVRSILRGTTVVLDDEIAAAAFGGMRWLRSCCNNAEPSIGVGVRGIAALATSQRDVGAAPTPQLDQLAVAVSPNGTHWSVTPVGHLLPEQGLDVTQILVVGDRFLVVVTERYPQPEGTDPAIVLVGRIG